MTEGLTCATIASEPSGGYGSGEDQPSADPEAQSEGRTGHVRVGLSFSPSD
jgi:hypothetical protein